MTWIVAAEAMAFAVYAQMLLARRGWPGLLAYALALALWWWAVRQDGRLLGETRPLPALSFETRPWYRCRWRLLLLGVSGVATVVNVIYSWDDTFETAGVIAWVVSVTAFVAAFWEYSPRSSPARTVVDHDGVRLSWPTATFLIVLVLGAVFRLWHLHETPPEMTMDHAYHLLDILDLVEYGQRPSFFCRNFGREPWQFYWTAALIRLTGLEIDFYTLKLGTALAGLLTLPGVYLMARELYGRWVGLSAAAFVAVASWPVILSRLGLRSPFAPLASAWTFYFMLRGLRTGHRNDFLLLGLALGMGLYGYSAFRAIPLAVALCWGAVWLTARHGDLGRRFRWVNPVLATLSALLVFIPLGAFMLCRPDAFWERSSWYLTDNEIPGQPVWVFLRNIGNLALMFHWRGDGHYLSGLQYEPVLDPILAGLMILGLAIAVAHIVARRGRAGLTLGLLVAGAVALVPSALSLAFPRENPSAMRASSAIPVIFTLAALPAGLWIEGVVRASRRRWQRVLAGVGVAVLVVALVLVNGRRVFTHYVEGYRRAVVNTSEIAAAIRGFDATVGSVNDAYVVAWPHWVDVRVLAFELGIPNWSNRLDSADQAEEHAGEERAQMYVLHPADSAGLQRLRRLFPDGLTRTYHSQWGHDFVLYIYLPSPTMEQPGE